MDTKLHASILREHSEQIGKVATALSAQLRQLETLGESQNAAPAATGACLDGLEHLQETLNTETEIFCKRLLALIERTRTQLPIESSRYPAERSVPPLQPEPREHIVLRGTPSYAALTERARETVREAREAVTSAYQSYARSRNALKSTEDLFQHLQARREREAEQPPSLSIFQPPRPTAQESDAPPEPVPAGEPTPLKISQNNSSVKGIKM